MNVLWAYEPFYQNLESIQSMYLLLKNINNDTNFKINFLSVINKHESGFARALDVPEIDRFTTYPQELIKNNLTKAKISLSHHEIFTVNLETSSLTKTVDKFIQLSSQKKYDFIALFSNSRTSNTLLSIGSFTESIIHRAKLNLIILNPKVEINKNIKKISFAMDFEKNNEDAIEFVINFCKKNSCRLEIIYHANLFYDWNPVAPSKRMINYRKKVNEYKEKLGELLQKKGINFQFRILSDIRSTTEIILQEAKNFHSNLLIINARKSRINSLIGGSTTRNLVKSSNLPLIILK
jgi:nucleotide-binding universal stress UspA family protein